MIDGLFPSCGNLKLEETKLALTRYSHILPLFSFCPKIHQGIKAFCDRSANWYRIKYDDMSALSRLWYDDKNEVIQLNLKIQDVKTRTIEWAYEPDVFIREYQEYKRFLPKATKLQITQETYQAFLLIWKNFP
ncbi:MAG: hypothetical protein ACK4HV_03350 [Parachlamydiaceae bacterium]